MGKMYTLCGKEDTMNHRTKNYGPDMTPEMRAELLAEIAAFDKKATLNKIEREAVGGPDVSAYWNDATYGSDLKSAHRKIGESTSANPDVLSEDKAVNFNSPILPSRYAEAEKDIDEILSTRELQVWRLVMRRGMSHKHAGDLLHLGEGSVRTYLNRAKDKIERYIGGQNA